MFIYFGFFFFYANVSWEETCDGSKANLFSCSLQESRATMNGLASLVWIGFLWRISFVTQVLHLFQHGCLYKKDIQEVLPLEASSLVWPSWKSELRPPSLKVMRWIQRICERFNSPQVSCNQRPCSLYPHEITKHRPCCDRPLPGRAPSISFLEEMLLLC